MHNYYERYCVIWNCSISICM